MYYQVYWIANFIFPLPCALAIYLLLLYMTCSNKGTTRCKLSLYVTSRATVAPADNAESDGATNDDFDLGSVTSDDTTLAFRTENVRMLAFAFLVTAAMKLPFTLVLTAGDKLFGNDMDKELIGNTVDGTATSYYLAFAVNPYAYAVVSKELRVAFLRTIRRCCTLLLRLLKHCNFTDD